MTSYLTPKEHYQFHCYLVDCLLHHCQDVTFSYAKKKIVFQTPSHLLSLYPHPATLPKTQHITDLESQVHHANMPIHKTHYITRTRTKLRWVSKNRFKIKHPAYWGQLNSEHSQSILTEYLDSHPLTASTPINIKRALTLFITLNFSNSNPKTHPVKDYPIWTGEH